MKKHQRLINCLSTIRDVQRREFKFCDDKRMRFATNKDQCTRSIELLEAHLQQMIDLPANEVYAALESQMTRSCINEMRALKKMYASASRTMESDNVKS